jgi:hypothetical protein
MTVKHSKRIEHTLANDEPNYSNRYSAVWDEGCAWVRFGSDEFQFTISSEGVDKLKELVDAFVEYRNAQG